MCLEYKGDKVINVMLVPLLRSEKGEHPLFLLLEQYAFVYMALHPGWIWKVLDERKIKITARWIIEVKCLLSGHCVEFRI